MAKGKGYTTQDAALIVAKALAASAGAINSDALDLGPITAEIGVRSEKFELELTTPALTATLLPASNSITYSLQASNDSTFATGVTTYAIQAALQTGSSSGATGGTFRFKPTLDSPRYWRAVATVTGSGVGSGITASKFTLAYVC